MPIGAKLVILLYIHLALNCQATRANPQGVERSARTKNDVYDWFSSIFGDYDSDDSESEEYLICRNCTVIIGQANATETTAAPATVAPTPPGGGVVAPPGPTAAPPPDGAGGVTLAPTPAPIAAPTPAPIPAPTPAPIPAPEGA